MKYRTPAEEILFSVQQWYLSRGLRVPADELKVCRDDIDKERREMEYNSAVLMRKLLEDEFECVKGSITYEKSAEFILAIADYKKKVDSYGIIEVKPSYGSQGFWKDYWAKKKAAGWVPKHKTHTKQQVQRI